MSFVPVVVTPPPPSPRARELGDRLTRTIDRYRTENPSVSPSEIQQALSLATRGIGSGNTAAVLVVLLVGMLLLGVLMFFYIT